MFNGRKGLKVFMECLVKNGKHQKKRKNTNTRQKTPQYDGNVSHYRARNYTKTRN